jgi:glycosyltransferase involved in cell wall biosynthesis
MVCRAIRSVLAQEFNDFELVVVDDGSSMRARILEIFPQFKGNDQFRVAWHPCNKGAAATRNTAINIARGKYVSFLDDDDELRPTFLGATNEAFRADPSLDVTWCGLAMGNYSADAESGTSGFTRDCSWMGGDRTSIYENVLSIGMGFGLTARTKVLRDIGGFDTTLWTVEDTDIFFRLLEGGYTPGAISGVHVTIHNHPFDRLTSQAFNDRRIEECEILLQRYGALFLEYPSLRVQLERQVESLRSSTCQLTDL